MIDRSSAARRAVLERLRGVPADVRLFLAMMAALVPARVLHTARIKTMYVDGGYYAEVARHVRDGDGIVSNASLYHFGYEHFPFRTSVYPLWVTVLGLSARFVDLVVVAHWLPLLCSFGAVLAAFLFGRKLWPEPLFPDHLPGLHAGHVFAMCLAVHGEFVEFTSLPYTEGIAWMLLFLFLWRTATKGPDTSVAWGVESGLWLGIVYLARFQMLVVPLAAAAAYAVRLALGPDRRRLAVHAAVALGIAGAILGGWWWHLTTFVYRPGLSSLLRFDQNRANDLLHPVDVIVETPGLGALALDRLAGVSIAWDPTLEASYTGPYYAMHWALPFALPFLAYAGARAVRDGGLARAVAWLRRPEHAHWWLVIGVAIGGLLSVQLVHKHLNGSWYFTKRQGLMSLLAFALPLAWLLRQARPPLAKVLGVLVLSTTAMAGARGIWVQATETFGETRREERHQAIIDWMTGRVPGADPLIVAMDAEILQRVVWRTTRVGYHWIDDQTRLDDLQVITGRLGADWVIVRTSSERDDDWTMFADRPAFDAVYEPVAAGPEGYRIYRARPRPLPYGLAPTPPLPPAPAPREDRAGEDP